MSAPVAATIGQDQVVSSVVGAGTVPGPIAAGALLGLIWDGATYQPAALRNNVSALKLFVGPTDPHTVSGVVLGRYDQWIQTLT